jgi:hypothetical protein
MNRPAWLADESLNLLLTANAYVAFFRKALTIMENPPPLPVENPTGKATAGLVLGIVGLIAWFIPLFGFPITITGLVLSIKGLKSTSRGMAMAGLVMNIIGLVLTTLNSAYGAYLAATGQMFHHQSPSQ